MTRLIGNTFGVYGPEQECGAALIYDTFGRTETDGWGTSDTGQTWVPAGAAESNFSVSGGKALWDCTQAGAQFRATWLNTGVSDMDVRLGFSWGSSVTGDVVFFELVGRSVPPFPPGPNNDYRMTLIMDTGGGVTGELKKRVADVDTVLGVLPALAGVAGGVGVRVRMFALGDVIKAKMWRAQDPEPAAWGVESIATNVPPNTWIGCAVFKTTGNTSTTQVMAVDNVSVIRDPGSTESDLLM